MKNLFLAASLTALAIPSIAQSTGAAAKPKSRAHKAAVQPRKNHQQRRIVHGAQNGKLTALEAASLKKKGSGLNAQERDMREDNRGRLTSADRLRLQHQKNRISRVIDHKKHNAVVASARAKGTAGPRPQQRRNAELKTGQLTTHQAAHLETKEASFHRQINSAREQDGKVPESTEPNQQPNKTTYEIHLKQHNARMF